MTDPDATANASPYAPPAASPTLPLHAPRPWIAGVLALALPVGVAHSYVGLPRRGAALAAVLAGVGAAGALLLPSAAGSFLVAVPLAAIALLALGRVIAAADVLRERSRFVAAPLAAIVTRVIVGWVVFGAFAATVAVGIRYFVVEAFKIPSAAMAPSLLPGDHVFVDKKSRDARRGDIVVFEYPGDTSQDFVFRAVGLPGDVVQVDGGRLSLNGAPVRRCPLGKAALPTHDAPLRSYDLELELLDTGPHLVAYDPAAPADPAFGPYSVKPGEYFVLGDNRNNSFDSRAWFDGKGGGVGRDLVKGRAFVIWLSLQGEHPDMDRTLASLDRPMLPPGAEDLRPALTACLTQLRRP